MESATFRKWLADRGCRFDQHKHRGPRKGHAIVTVHRDGRVAELPLVGSRQHLDPDLVRQICEKLNLDWSELPGPKGRA
jgi:mRNA interferase HicA